MAYLSLQIPIWYIIDIYIIVEPNSHTKQVNPTCISRSHSHVNVVLYFCNSTITELFTMIFGTLSYN